MSSNKENNLIDLSTDEEATKSVLTTNPSQLCDKMLLNSIPILILPSGRESLENNPFDKVLKETIMQDDPFELVAQEARQRNNHSNNQNENPMPFFNDKDNSVSYDQLSPNDFPTSYLDPSVTIRNQFGSVSSITNSSISHDSNNTVFCESISPILKSFELQNESSTNLYKHHISDSTIKTNEFRNESSITLNKGFILDSTIKSTSDSTGTNSELDKGFIKSNSENSVDNSKLQISTSDRKQLLKLSLTNSANNSPLMKLKQQNDDSFETLVLEEASQIADRFSQTALKSLNQQSEDSCDDLMKIKPNWIDSETDIDSDLELLKIPILQDIENQINESPIYNVQQSVLDDYERRREKIVMENEKLNAQRSKVVSQDIQELKHKVNQHKIKENPQDISDLISSMKRIVLECPNKSKKEEASNLLESLSTLLNEKSINETEVVTPPQPITRQGTFDLERPKKNKHDSETNKIINDLSDKTPQSQSSGKKKSITDLSDKSPQSSEKNKTNTDLSDQTSQSSNNTDAPNIVKLIEKLLENQNINVVQANMSSATGNNPTYIVVMNTPLRPVRQGTQIMEEPDGSPELKSEMRTKRSQSVSLHDKPGRLSISKRNLPIGVSTPIKSSSLNRRNSICSSPSVTNAVRRSIYAQNIKESEIPKIMSKRSIAVTNTEKKIVSKNISNIKPDLLSKKLRVKPSEPAYRTSGPIKATIPIRKVAPMVLTSSISSPIEDIKTSKYKTSTPNETSNSNGFPSACSTPVAQAKLPETSPIRNRVRYSYMSTTPNPKSNSISKSSVNYRKRSLTEFKSPKKSIDSVKDSGISKPQIRTMKLPQDFPINSNMKQFLPLKGTFYQKRLSTQQKNKENKHPN